MTSSSRPAVGAPEAPTETTPRPWRQVDRGPAYDWNEWHFIQGADGGRKVGRASYEDAALIVEAVNNYDRLRAIEAAAQALDDDGNDHPDFCQCDGHLALRAALSSAEPTPTEGRQP